MLCVGEFGLGHVWDDGRDGAGDGVGVVAGGRSEGVHEVFEDDVAVWSAFGLGEEFGPPGCFAEW